MRRAVVAAVVVAAVVVAAVVVVVGFDGSPKVAAPTTVPVGAAQRYLEIVAPVNAASHAMSADDSPATEHALALALRHAEPGVLSLPVPLTAWHG